MKAGKSLKIALMAASALAASSAVIFHASPAAPAPTEAAPIEHAADDQARAPAPAITAKKVGLAALTASAAAAFVHFVGANRILAFFANAGPAAAKAARAAAAAPVAAARAIGRAAASPLRFALLFGGLGLFALTGVWIYDVEWLGGLAAGAGLVGLVWFAAARTRRAVVRRIPAPKAPKP
jgi:hypothetical protein